MEDHEDVVMVVVVIVNFDGDGDRDVDATCDAPSTDFFENELPVRSILLRDAGQVHVAVAVAVNVVDHAHVDVDRYSG